MVSQSGSPAVNACASARCARLAYAGRRATAARDVGAEHTYLTHLTHDNLHADLAAELPREVFLGAERRPRVHHTAKATG